MDDQMNPANPANLPSRRRFITITSGFIGSLILGDRALGATKPVAKKPAAKKPVAKKPAAKKPIVKATSKPTPSATPSASPSATPSATPSASPSASPSNEIKTLDVVPAGAVAIKKSGVALTLADIEVGKTIAATNSATNTNLFVARLGDDSFKGYPTSCTHQGGPLAIQGKTLECPWHGAKFDALTGAVINSPATNPLAPIKVAAINGALYIL